MTLKYNTGLKCVVLKRINLESTSDRKIKHDDQ